MDQRRNRKYFKLNDNEDMPYQKFCADTKAMFREKCITLTTFTMKVERLKSIQLHFKKQKRVKPKNVGRRKQNSG